MTNKTEKKKIPNPVDFLLQTPLYETFTVIGFEAWDVIALMYFKDTLDCYCPECGNNATFKGITPVAAGDHVRNVKVEFARKAQGLQLAVPTLEVGPFKVILQCTRNSAHFQYYFFLIKDSRFEHINKRVVNILSIVKIGQYPSYGDLNLFSIKKYGSVLGKTLLRELSRAISLASHDVGVGSYVYLRRVFEALIEDAHQAAKKEKKWSEKKYIKSRMAERIKMMKKHLPIFLVENPTMYSLLSKGIHELSEQDCLDHFQTLKIGIELILDEKLEQRERQQKIQQAKVAIQKAAENIEKNTACTSLDSQKAGKG